jgi:hypothetical protein
VQPGVDYHLRTLGSNNTRHVSAAPAHSIHLTFFPLTNYYFLLVIKRVAQGALPATIAMFNAVQMELGIQCKIGATIGEAYCGVAGGVKRHKYAVLGLSINLAAQLMASQMNPAILVDNNVCMMAHRSYAFNALPPVVAKGYAEPVPIFEPLSPLERSWGRIQPNFVGRKYEILEIMGMAQDMVLSESLSKLVLV